MYKDMHTCHIQMHIHMCICTSDIHNCSHIHAYMTHTYTNSHIYINACTDTQIHTHTHTHRYTVLVRVTIAVMKHHDQSNLGRKGFIGLHCIIRRSQDRNSNRAGTRRQELMQRPWRKAAYWLAQPGTLWDPGPPAQEWHHPQ